MDPHNEGQKAGQQTNNKDAIDFSQSFTSIFLKYLVGVTILFFFLPPRTVKAAPTGDSSTPAATMTLGRRYRSL